eukprot:m.27617 g.27617  ORF g.27617 m.27617 type:complete len:85 (+) comp8588_c0_seq2:1207-1461(+)
MQCLSRVLWEFDSSQPTLIVVSIVRTNVVVCGPVCESADIFGRDRDFPAETAEGDVVLIDCAGAYARTMASEYNMRAIADEILL